MPKITKAKKRSREDQGTKDLLLDIAAAIMSERRRIDVTLSELGERSGMNTALVRYYFSNKSGMMMALTERTLNHASWGHIVNISYMFGLVSVPEQATYCASKFTVHGFTKPLRQELEHSKSNISCTSVHPGMAKTKHRLLIDSDAKVIHWVKRHFPNCLPPNPVPIMILS